MKDQDITTEIERIKKQLEALTAARAQASEHDAGEGPGEASSSPGGEGDAGSWLRDLLKQAEELIGGLDLQFKDVPARTALVIFVLGVLTGRLLGRRG